MERIKILLILFCLPLSVVAASIPIEIDNAFNNSFKQTISPTTPQNVSFKLCTKSFNINSESLYYLTLASINANNFQIEELQTKCGYILFTAVSKQFLATVSGIDDKNSILKITPCDNNYFFSPGIVTNIFKYIELNLDNSIDKMN